MKDMFSSPEAFTAHATIQAGMYMLRRHQLEHDNKWYGRTGIEIAIDQSTGHDNAILLEYYAGLVVIMDDIIAAKKVIGDDHVQDDKVRSMAQEQINKLNVS